MLSRLVDDAAEKPLEGGWDGEADEPRLNVVGTALLPLVCNLRQDVTAVSRWAIYIHRVHTSHTYIAYIHRIHTPRAYIAYIHRMRTSYTSIAYTHHMHTHRIHTLHAHIGGGSLFVAAQAPVYHRHPTPTEPRSLLVRCRGTSLFLMSDMAHGAGRQ